MLLSGPSHLGGMFTPPKALLQGMPFEWCIMDEAGQIAQPAAIGPLHYCQKFMLIGDDYQLPPLIVSLEAKSLVGASFSLI